ncbi:hypothetical protein HGRIS_011459 [Hohenbuehelia grisea]|uniref:Mitochondrial glyco protein n=1 Tax=Hohenbuehelia grisea TaxID=104357 RepID=A0ABR3JVZ1_9AGAR
MSGIRALRQLANASCRRSVARTSASSRACSAVLRYAQPSRAFSVSARTFGEGSTDLALSQKLQEELKFEKEDGNGAEEIPEFLKVFQEQGIWQVEDTPGCDEVTLTRKFGNENIRLIFSIADIQAEEEEPEFAEGQEGEGENAGEDPEDPLHSYPIRASLSITKTAGPGALNVDMVSTEGHFIVDNISFYRDTKLGVDLTAEADWKRRGLYIGPQFDTLDVAVQEEFEKFLQERGINESVALFIPEYAEYKEQKEYVQWLESVKNFIDL